MCKAFPARADKQPMWVFSWVQCVLSMTGATECAQVESTRHAIHRERSGQAATAYSGHEYPLALSR